MQSLRIIYCENLEFLRKLCKSAYHGAFRKIHSQEETGLPNVPAIFVKLIDSLYHNVVANSYHKWQLQFSYTPSVLGLLLNPNNQLVANRGVAS